ncbi:hypothetical protein [Rhodopseudomonas sp.]|uniref:hypothetical protein n=1 Tax=Rhodopseudomonas sp. TaxID=1078 RepID=UPI003B3B51CB
MDNTSDITFSASAFHHVRALAASATLLIAHRLAVHAPEPNGDQCQSGLTLAPANATQCKTRTLPEIVGDPIVEITAMKP